MSDSSSADSSPKEAWIATQVNIPHSDDGTEQHELTTFESPSGTRHIDIHTHSSQSSEKNEDKQEEDDDEPTITIKGKTIPLKDAVYKNTTPTSVEVRNLTYKVEVQEGSGIQTLSTMFQRKKKFERTILDNISFVLEPGTMTLLLGGPGSGKTSLFDIIAQRRKGNIEGMVTLNGSQPDHDTYHRALSYCVQGDTHFALMTVRETLEFAAACQMPEGTTDEQRAERIEVVLQLLGLAHRADTIVGDTMHRGVSGGEKRRVTIATEWLKGPLFIMLDEPTTGLDSAAALDVVKTLKVIAQMGTPVLCALLQPSWEIVNHFDKLLLLSHGTIAYDGPVPASLDYFAEVGYSCPLNYSKSEFISELVDHPEKFEFDEESGHPKTITTSQGFIDHWRSSKQAAAAEARMKERFPLKPGTTHQMGSLAGSDLEVERYPTSMGKQLQLNLWRGGILFKREWKTRLTILINNAFLGFILGGFFFGLKDDQNDYGIKLALLFFCIVNTAFAAVSGIPLLFDERAVYYHQRSAKYYSTFPYFFSKIVWMLPSSIGDVIVFGTIVYWMASLNDEASRFFFFLLMLFGISFTYQTFSRMCSSTMPNATLGSLLGTSLTALFLLFSGFLIARDNIPDPWIWMYYISTLQWMIQGLAINEMSETSLYCSENQLLPPKSVPLFDAPFAEGGFESTQVCRTKTGTQVLNGVGFSTELYMRWVMFAIVLGYWALYAILMFLGLKYLRYESQKTGSTSATADAEKNDKKNEIIKENTLVTSFDDIQDTKNALSKGATMVWRNLQYTVPQKKTQLRLLNDITGYVQPGMLLALMGASGAGKSTLLDVLAQRKNVGKIEGEILLNGKKPDQFFRRLVGYVEQTDIHYPFHTVAEAVNFSAKCRLPEGTTKEKRRATVKRVLQLLDLEPIANTLIGEGEGGLSLEQRKRVSIAVELASDPEILFLDEPTSGLDSDGADKVMAVIKRVSDAGTSVICTIHQPSSRIFSRATHLLLLKKGGRMVYFGELGKNFNTMLSYFAKLGRHCPPDENPATFVLDLTDAGLGRKKKKAVTSSNNAESSTEEEVTLDNVFDQSELKTEMVSRVDSLVEELKQAHIDDEKRRTYPLHYREQLNIIMERFMLGIWRNPKELMVMILRGVILAFIFGTVYQLKEDQQGATMRIALLFIGGIYANLSAFSAMPVAFAQRPIYYREEASGFYRSSAFTIGKVLADLPLQLMGEIIFGIMLYWITGLRQEAGHFFFFMLVIIGLSQCALQAGVVLTTLLPTAEAAGILFGSVFSLFALAAGFLIPKSSLPDYLVWLYYMSFFHYSLEPLTVNELSGLKLGCPDNKGAVAVDLPSGNTQYYCAITSGDQTIKQLGMDPDMKWPDVAILYGCYMIFILICILGLKYIKHQKR